MAITFTCDRHTGRMGSAGQDLLDAYGYVTMDSSYSADGELLTAAIVNTGLAAASPVGRSITTVEQVLAQSTVVSSVEYLPEWIASTGKLKVWKRTESVASSVTKVTDSVTSVYKVTEEKVTVTTNVGTLTNAPLAVIAVRSTAGDVKAVMAIADSAATIATKECKVDHAAKTVTFEAGTDKVTEAQVVYLYQSTAGSASSTTPGTSGTASSIAEASGNLSAVSFNVHIVCAI